MTLLAAGVSLAGSIRWSAEIPEIIKIIAAIITGAGTILLFFRRVRNKIYSIYDYFYQKLPSVRAHFQKINQIAETLPQMGEQLSRIERNSTITRSLLWAQLDDSYDAKILTDEHGNWRRVNKTFLRWMSATDTDVLDNGWRAFLSQECRRTFLSDYDEAIKQTRRGNFKCTFKRNGIINYDVDFILKPVKDGGILCAFEITMKSLNL